MYLYICIYTHIYGSREQSVVVGDVGERPSDCIVICDYRISSSSNSRAKDFFFRSSHTTLQRLDMSYDRFDAKMRIGQPHLAAGAGDGGEVWRNLCLGGALYVSSISVRERNLMWHINIVPRAAVA